MVRLVPVLLLLALACISCSEDAAPAGADPAQVDATAAPEERTCRNLTAADLRQPTNATPTVPCEDPHNAATYAAGELPSEFAESEPDDPALADWAYTHCSTSLERHLGATKSQLMRSMISWVWFSPSEDAWADGARWYRCDLVGGGRSGADHIDLPTTTKNLFRGRVDDRWMVCARGEDVNGDKVPCSESHNWRAVTTIKVGETSEDYPGREAVESTTESYCEGSVEAWLGYPSGSYDYGYTWFGATEWEAGNRLSVCWARTER